jgi:hypothetical protein
MSDSKYQYHTCCENEDTTRVVKNITIEHRVIHMSQPSPRHDIFSTMSLAVRDIVETCSQTRWIFRKHVFLQVSNANIRAASKVGDATAATLSLDFPLWKLIDSSRAVLLPPCIAVVNVTRPQNSVVRWSESFIADTIRNATLFGDMGKHSCIIMLIYFSVGEIDHEAVSVVILDAAGIAYAYNVPKGDCADIAFQCVSTLL